jgi:hypothetical protein
MIEAESQQALLVLMDDLTAAQLVERAAVLTMRVGPSHPRRKSDATSWTDH